MRLNWRTQVIFVHFVQEAYKHFKAIAVFGDAKILLPKDSLGQAGVISADSVDDSLKAKFIDAIALHRHWGRNNTEMIPA